MSAINYGHHTGLGQILTFNPFSSQQSYLLSIVIMAMNYLYFVIVIGSMSKQLLFFGIQTLDNFYYKWTFILSVYFPNLLSIICIY